MTLRVIWPANDSSMKTNNEFVIPVGTEINTRNVTADLRLRKHVTTTELRFTDLSNTGDGGFVYYFEHGDWLIAVNANLVRNGEEEMACDPMPDDAKEKSVLFPSLDNIFLREDGIRGVDRTGAAIYGASPLDKTA